MNDADDITNAAPPTPTYANAWNASGIAQPMPRNQVASESTNGNCDSALYVDRILHPLEPTRTPEELRPLYPEGSYSVSRQTVEEHGQYRLRGLRAILDLLTRISS